MDTNIKNKINKKILLAAVSMCSFLASARGTFNLAAPDGYEFLRRTHPQNLTPDQRRYWAGVERYEQSAINTPLVQAALKGDLGEVRRICAYKGEEWDYVALRTAVAIGRDDIAKYIAFDQPKAKGGDFFIYNLFWRSALLGDKDVFDFFIRQKINVHKTPLTFTSWHYDGEKNIDEKYKANTMNHVEVGYKMYGDSEDRQYIKSVLDRMGVVASTVSEEPGCCSVQ
jgi:hypothetical protein